MSKHSRFDVLEPEAEARGAGEAQRLRITVAGAVQGVGFRPFVYRRAATLALGGWVANTPEGVVVEIEGPPGALNAFLRDLRAEAPFNAQIEALDIRSVDPAGSRAFEIRPSNRVGAKTAAILPDIATCADCRREIFDPGDRRHLYPFTNCTNCGPRYSIMESLPYDRDRTSMRRFAMCGACRDEYEDPRNRRFHAQANACPDCGPQIALWNGDGDVLASRHDALREAASAIRAGRIVALKGLGGFHLVADARNDEATGRLRAGKKRPEKPFALMFPGLEGIEACCRLAPEEAALLRSPQAPIVLVPRRAREEGPPLSDAVAPGSPWLGAMLPYTPLHHLLLAELGFPVVATSGNVSNEPIVSDERDALRRLAGVADVFLVHDRPIVHAVDDSVVRVAMGRELVLRAARGYAPVAVGKPGGREGRRPSVLAVGGHLKNTVSVSAGGGIFVGPHMGDLETAEAVQAFEGAVAAAMKLHDIGPEVIACDMHPDYRPTRYAERSGLPCVRVQHHLAHVAGCMAEHGLDGPVLGVAWDGAGYGPDRTVWGGEFLLVSGPSWQRIGHLRRFRLPGGEAAMKEPRRAAIGALHEIFGAAAFAKTSLAPLQSFCEPERKVLRSALERGINAPVTSSAGRLFDAVAALLGLRQQATYEGQAAAELEWAASSVDTDARFAFDLGEMAGDADVVRFTVDWGPMLSEILSALDARAGRATIAAAFHNTLAEAVVAAARAAGQEDVVLTGGCFQNRYLTERTVRRLQKEGFRPYWHHRVPPNDGGLSLGQAAWAARVMAGG